MLHKYVGKIIVKEYKKENPQKQSIWSSDTSRLNFVIKQMVGENDVSEWISDKSGIKISKYIISPLLDNIKNLMITEAKRLTQKAIDMNKRDNEYRNYADESEIGKQIISCYEIIGSINKNIMHNEVLKYIAPHFNLVLKSLDLLNKHKEFVFVIREDDL